VEFPQDYDFRPDLESNKDLLLDMANERSLEPLLSLVVRRLAERPPIALARIWLLGPGDICPACPMRAECPDQTTCLHLAASAGRPSVESGEDWSRLDGHFRRFPLGVRKVGQIAATGRAIVIPDVVADHAWIARPDWARREGIRGFHGQPIIQRGEVLGVLALFDRIRVPDEARSWLRILADHLGAAIANARAFEEIQRLRQQLERENTYLQQELANAQAFGPIVGRSPALRNVQRQIEIVASTDATVLVLGESGTGKELVAREIHARGERRDRPVITVNCASVPRELYESEFFGHVKGAFTGALRDRVGRFELAHGGTLFLDEVGEIPLELQPKLLRVLQDGQFERVGEERTRTVDVRIIAATNRDLRHEVHAGRFRQDLYYRLNVFPIEIAPLRQRKEDIAILAAHFLEQSARKLNLPAPRLTPADALHLQAYDWPGNVRELQNVVERAVIGARFGPLQFLLPESPPAPTAPAQPPGPDEIVPEAEMIRREWENMRRALQRADGKIYGPGGAAELLGMKPTTLASRVRKLGLDKPT
jgi:transcriptional regulator with GAF, ATPase, and Fis domain